MFTLKVAEGYGWEIASALPDTQDEWLKGKDDLIEKARTLADVKKNKRQKIKSVGRNYFQKGYNYQETYKSANLNSSKSFRSYNQTQNRTPNLSGKCYICGGLGHFANSCPSDPNEGTSNFRSRGYSTYKNRFNKSQETARND